MSVTSHRGSRRQMLLARPEETPTSSLVEEGKTDADAAALKLAVPSFRIANRNSSELPEAV